MALPGLPVISTTSISRVPYIEGTFDSVNTTDLVVTVGTHEYELGEDDQLLSDGDRWFLQADRAFPLGPLTVTVEASNADGTVSDSVEFVVESAINEWRGDSEALNHAVRIVVGQVTPRALYEVSIGTKKYSARADDESTTTSIAAALAEQLSNGGTWTVEAAGSSIVLTGRSPGEPIAHCMGVSNPAASYVTRVQSGQAPIVHELDVTLPEATSGGTWSITLNFGNGPETATGLAANVSPSAFASGLNALSTPTAAGGNPIEVQLTSASPRRYRIRLAGSMAGQTATVTSVNATQLTEPASATVTRYDNPSVGHAVWVIDVAHRTADASKNVKVTVGGQETLVLISDLFDEQTWEDLLPVPMTNYWTASMYDRHYPDNHTSMIVLAIPSSVVIKVDADAFSFTVQTRVQKHQDYMGATHDCFQIITFESLPDELKNTSRTLTFDGEETFSFVSNFTIVDALEALPNIGNGNVTVHVPLNVVRFVDENESYWNDFYCVIRFQNEMGHRSLPTLIPSEGEAGHQTVVLPFVNGGPRPNDIQMLSVSASGGTFTLSMSGATELDSASITAASGGNPISTPSDLVTAIANAWAFPVPLSGKSGSGGSYTVYLSFPVFNPTATTLTLQMSIYYSSVHGETLTRDYSGMAVPTTAGTHAVTLTGGAGDNRLPASMTLQCVVTEGGFVTEPISVPVSSHDLMQALEQELGEGNVYVSGLSPFLIESVGENASTTMPLLQVDATNLTATVSSPITHAVFRVGIAGKNEIQRIHVDSGAIGGTIRANPGMGWTTPIPHDASAAGWQSVFNTRFGLGNFAIEGTTESLLIEYKGIHRWQQLELIMLDQDALKMNQFGDSRALQLVETQPFAGPNCWNDPHNWTLGHVPTSLETVVLGSGRSAIQHGLLQMAECRFENDAVYLLGGGHLVDGQTVRLKTTGTLPTATVNNDPITLSVDEEYFVLAAERHGCSQVVQLGLTKEGFPIEFENNGTGQHRIGISLQAIQQYSRCTSAVGLPRRESSGEFVDLPRFLRLWLEDPVNGVPNLEVGIGEGSGSNLIHLDVDDSHLDARILKSGGGTGGLPAIQLLNNNLDESEITMINGSLGLGIEPTESVSIKKLTAFGGRGVIGTADIRRIEDYTRSIQFLMASASNDVALLRMR